jgi:hypothetical protein
MIVIYRNGRREVVTGWRAWLIVALAVLVAAAIIAIGIGLALGIALTLTVIALFAIPVVAALVQQVSLLQPRR